MWAVAGLGCVLPRALWQALRSELDGSSEPWEDVEEIVPIDLVDAVARPGGLERVADAVAKPDCGLAPELLRRVS